MSGMGPNLSVVNKNRGAVLKQLGMSPWQMYTKDSTKILNYENSFKNSLTDPLYAKAAEKLGIKNYSSVNDYTRVMDYLNGPKPSAAPEAAPKPAPDPTPVAPVVDQGIIDTTPGTNSNVNGNALGIRSRKSKAREAGLVGMGTNRLTIPRSSGASSLNLG